MLLFKYFVVIIISFFISSCSVVTLTAAWLSNDLPAQHLKKLLVVHITKEDEVRRLFEDEIVAELRKYSVQAVQSYSLIPVGGKSGYLQLLEEARIIGADGVITNRAAKIETQTGIEPGERYPGMWDPNAFPYMNMYGYYGSLSADEPSTTIVYKVETFQVNLFSINDGKLLWSGILQTADPDKVNAISKDLARIVVLQLINDGLILKR